MTGSSWGLPIGLSLLFIGLCAAIGFEVAGPQQTPDQQPPARAAPPAQSGPASLTEPPNQREAWFRTVVSRPLFSPDRRPASVETHEVVHGLPRLTAIIMTDSRRSAIFASPLGGHATVVEVGSHIGDYEVRDIADAGVTVVGPEGTTLVRPVFDAAPAVPGRPPVAARLELPKVQGR
jgi:hypothetical protein